MALRYMRSVKFPSAELVAARERIIELETAQNADSSAKNRQQKHIAKLEKKLQRLSTKSSSAEKEITELQALVDGLSNAFQSAEHEHAQTKKELQLEHVANHKTEVNELKLHVEELQHSIEKSKIGLGVKKNDCKILMQECKRLEEDVIHMQRQHKDKNEEAQQYKEEADRLRPRLGTLQDSLRQSQMEKQTAQQELAQARSETSTIVEKYIYAQQRCLDEAIKVKGLRHEATAVATMYKAEQSDHQKKLDASVIAASQLKDAIKAAERERLDLRKGKTRDALERAELGDALKAKEAEMKAMQRYMEDQGEKNLISLTRKMICEKKRELEVSRREMDCKKKEEIKTLQNKMDMKIFKMEVSQCDMKERMEVMKSETDGETSRVIDALKRKVKQAEERYDNIHSELSHINQDAQSHKLEAKQHKNYAERLETEIRDLDDLLKEFSGSPRQKTGHLTEAKESLLRLQAAVNANRRERSEIQEWIGCFVASFQHEGDSSKRSRLNSPIVPLHLQERLWELFLQQKGMIADLETKANRLERLADKRPESVVKLNDRVLNLRLENTDLQTKVKEQDEKIANFDRMLLDKTAEPQHRVSYWKRHSRPRSGEKLDRSKERKIRAI
jgi:chromosome segregation ATPase